MSGFVAIVERDGRPVDGRILDAMTAAMAYRGPDRASVLTATDPRPRGEAGSAGEQPSGADPERGADATFGARLAPFVGLAHAEFRTLEDPAEVAQPATLNERLWISADARIDGRAELAAKLAAAGIDDGSRNGGVAAATTATTDKLRRAPESTLLLLAYRAWGAAMLEHLLGDFAFVIWDEDQQILFCARDHFGVKPLYWAEAGSTLLVANTIESLRAHPGISDALDEWAIADYLLFGHNRHSERTSFADIRRLPPAHSLTWERSVSSAPVASRYWRLQVREQLRLGAEAAFVERFDGLLRAAVGDRVRGNRAAVLMSGGLDSTTVAAITHQVMVERYEEYGLAACTFAFDRSAEPDPEAEGAAAVAAALGIPHHRVPLDADRPSDLWGKSAAWSAEPTDTPASARIVWLMSHTVPGTRVGLTGQGGDPALHVTPEDALHRARGDGWLSTAATTLRYALRHRYLPRTGLRTAVKRRLRGRRFELPPVFPPWLRPDLVDRLALRQRLDDFFDRNLDPGATRPEAEHQLAGGEWSFLLEWYDPGATGFHAEMRHPLLDVRLVEFLLAVPPVPWLVEKEILRRAMRGRLPAATLSRRKAPLPGYPIHDMLISNGEGSLGLARHEDRLAEFIDVDCFATIARKPERLRPWEYELITRPLGLALWLGRLEAGAPRGTESPGE